MAYIIRTHSRNDFKTCRLQWLYKQSYEPTTLPENLEFGTAIHKGLEAYYDPNHIDFVSRDHAAVLAFKAKNQEQLKDHPYSEEIDTIEDYEGREELGIGMLSYYTRNYAPHNDDFKVIAVEWDFEVPVYVPDEYNISKNPFSANNWFQALNSSGFENVNGQLYFHGNPVVYQGTIDMIVEKDGELFIVDHKTRRAFKDSTFHLDVDTQISSYAWAASQFLQKPVTGIIFNELKKNYPKKPRVLNDGSLSKDKSQNTTYELYKEAIKERGFPIEGYDGILNYLKSQDENYVRRLEVERNKKQLEIQGNYIFQESVEMLNNPFIYPTPNEMNCPSCPFKYPCLARQEGEDETHILENEDLFTPIGVSDD